MKQNENSPRYQRLLKCFTQLPQQILSLSDVDNVTEYVLHSLCDEGCLNLSKAAYFIDNPDFDCLKGLAGFNKDEEIYTCDTVLNDEVHFREHMDSCAFNKKVRAINLPSARKLVESQDKCVQRLATILGIRNPMYHTWTIKHDNYGLLIFERAPIEDHTLQQEFLKGLSLLGFCPVS